MRCIHILLFLLRNLPAFPVPNIFSFRSMSPISYSQYHRLFSLYHGGVNIAAVHSTGRRQPPRIREANSARGFIIPQKENNRNLYQGCGYFWRRRRDSNSRTPLRVTRFPIVRARPATRLLRVNLNIQFAPFLQTPEHYIISKAKNQVIFSIIPIFFSQRLKQ